MMKNLKRKFFCLILLSLFIIPSVIIIDAEKLEPAEINAFVSGELPSIQVNKWTPINLTIENRFGIDWIQIQEIVPRLSIELLWPLNPAFPQPVKRFLGPTSLKLTGFVNSDNNDGWHFEFDPDLFNGSYTGDSHNPTMFVKVDDNAISYNETVIINCTRIDALGMNYGYSWIYLPLKVAPESYLSVSNLEQKITVTPKSLNTITFHLTNEGYYKNVFYLNTSSSTQFFYTQIHEQSAVIEPGETREVKLSFLTPERFYDLGTPHTINVFARHSQNDSFVHIGSLTVVTKGLFLSPLFFIGILILTLIILVSLILFILYRRYKKRSKLSLI